MFRLTLLATLDVLLVAQRGIIKGVLFPNLKLVGAGWIRRGRSLVAIRMLACSDLSRDLGESLKGSPGLTGDWEFNRLAVHLASIIRIICCVAREAVQFQQCSLSIMNTDTRALLHKVGGKAIDASLWELLAARFAGMFVTVARIV